MGSPGLLPVDYRDFNFVVGTIGIFVGMFLHSNTGQPHGETIEDKLGLVQKRLEAYLSRDSLVIVALGTIVEVHWWKRRDPFEKYDFEAKGGSLTRLFKANLAVDDEKMYVKQYLSLVKTCCDRDVDIRPWELKRTE